MCLAIPVEIVAIPSADRAIVQVAGIEKEISIALTPDVQVGDFVILHVGYALKKLNRNAAEKTLAYFSKLVEMDR